MDQTISTRIRKLVDEHPAKLLDGKVAETVGMTPSAFSLALKGKRGISAFELVRFADFFGVSVHWLITGEADPFEPQIAARHSYSEAGYQHAPDSSEAELLDNITLAYRQAYPEPVAGKQGGVPSAADSRLALGEGFAGSFAARVEEAFKVDVIRVAGVERAYSMSIGGRFCIVLGASANWFFQNFSIAHELGHIHFGHFNDDRADSRDQNELLANGYAADLLMPSDLLTEKDWNQMDGRELADLIWELGVSTQALRNRLDSLSVTVSDDIARLLDMKTQEVIRKYIPDSAADIINRMSSAAQRRFPTTLEQAHLEGIAHRSLSKGTLAWMLAVPEDELEVPVRAVTTKSLDDIAHQLGLPIQIASTC